MNVQDIRQTFAADPERLQQGRAQFEALMARSATDREFRNRLLSDPRGAVKDFTGQEMPEGMEIVFVENKATATVVLPDVTGGELSDADLESASGGFLPLAAAIFCAFVAGATSAD